MIKNYFKTAFRNLWRNKTFSVIKILGLSIGLAVCMLIFLYTKDELSYDQFHKNKAQLFRIIQNLKFGADAPQTIGITTPVMGETFAAEVPEVKQYVSIKGESVTIKKKKNDVLTEQCMFVDDNFFTVFSFPLVEGNKRTALKDPHSVVLSKKTAIKYFGTEDAVGETLQIKKGDEFENYTVTAITENSPQNSSIKADMYVRIRVNQLQGGDAWLGGSLNTFLLLSPQADVPAVENKMQAVFDRNTKDFIAKAEREKGMTFKAKLVLQPLTDIHLAKKAGPDNGLSDGSKSSYSYILTC